MVDLTRKQIAVIGLLQVGAVLVGYVGVYLAVRAWEKLDLEIAPLTTLIASYGLILIVVPLAWSALATYVLSRGDASPLQQAEVFLSGVLLILGITVLMVYAGMVTYESIDFWGPE